MKQTKQSEDYLYGLWKKAYQNDDEKAMKRLKDDFNYTGQYRYTEEKTAEAKARADEYEQLFGNLGLDPDDDVCQFIEYRLYYDVHGEIVSINATTPTKSVTLYTKNIQNSIHTTITTKCAGNPKSKTQILKEVGVIS